jgi:hypothetical protein
MGKVLQRSCHAAKREGHHESRPASAGFLAGKWGHSYFPRRNAAGPASTWLAGK